MQETSRYIIDIYEKSDDALSRGQFVTFLNFSGKCVQCGVFVV